MSDQIEPASAQDEREPVDVAAWLSETCSRGRTTIRAALSKTSLEVLRRGMEDHEAMIISDQPLMTVAQHERIVAELTRPAQTEQQPAAYPHEAMDKMATGRYRVGAAGAGTLHRFAVRAGDGEQELYRGSESDCQHVARKLAGAFLDGGMALQSVLASSIAQAEQPSAPCT